MYLQRFDPLADETRLDACYQLVLTGQEFDDPDAPPLSPRMFLGWWGYGFAGEPRQLWLATADDGSPVGCYLLELPDTDNRNNAFCYPVVGAAFRRQGIGTMLVAHAAGQAEQAGRTLLMSWCRVGAPGPDFAAAIGCRAGLRDVRRTLDLGPDLYPRLAELRAAAEPHAAGYTLRAWLGDTPAELIGQTCALYEALADAPHDEAYEPSRWDPDRLRAAEVRVAAQGSRWYSFAALHEATGDMAALTQLTVDPAEPGWGNQEITAVARPHRGHRLGLLVKIAMLQRLADAEPQLRHIMTFNSAPNEHMIAVNAELGHRVTDYFQSFELDVTTAIKLARPR